MLSNSMQQTQTTFLMKITAHNEDPFGICYVAKLYLSTTRAHPQAQTPPAEHMPMDAFHVGKDL